jgi:ribose transport system permease protein
MRPRGRSTVNGVALIPYVILVLLYVTMILLAPKLFNFAWLGLKTNDAMTLILVSMGQTIVMLAGGIDLSVGGVICVTNSIAALYMQNTTGGMLLMSVAMLALGAAIGLLNGIAITRTQLQPFIVTLASWSVWGGVAIWILPIDGGTPPKGFINALLARPAGISLSIILIVVFILAWFVFKRTRLGSSIYAVGSSEKAAHLNGINVNRTKLVVYGLSGLLAAAAGLYRTAQLASGSPLAGNSFIMTSIVAAVIGGTSLAGGRGGLVGSMLGAIILRLITDVLVFLGVSTYWSTLCQGLLLILAVVVSSVATIAKRKEVQL